MVVVAPVAATPGDDAVSGAAVAPGRAAAADLDELFSSISCRVDRAGRCSFPAAWRQEPASPSQYRLFVCLSGSAECDVGGETHALREGSVLLVPPGQSLAARTTRGRPLTAYVLEFVAQLHGLLDVPAFCGLPVLIEPSPYRRPKLAASAQSIVRHLSLRIPGYQLAVHTHCIRLLDLLWKEALTQGPVSNATGTGRAMAVSRLLPVFRLIEARYAERLHLIDLAAVVHLHPAYFATVFKRLTGVAPLHYLARYRLERARTLLLATDRPLEEVARRTGFYDAAHLIRAFRAVEGDSPGHFRRSKARPTSS